MAIKKGHYLTHKGIKGKECTFTLDRHSLTDKIILKGMKFYGYHGVYPEEQAKGQCFVIDAVMYVDLREAGVTDDLEKTVDYSQVYNIIKDITEGKRFKLIERLADAISREILSKYEMVEGVKVTVKKPDAPINGEFEWVGVETERFRNG
ncbi:MAG TPA: dihydroneopterin aldolase [Clostridiaceae bacterium]|nr:dihydroneopterin aldolase [Clostridiaceae bacterium]